MAISTTATATAPDNPLLHGPILPRLIGFALPNMGAMVAGSVAAIAETAYVGQLGVPALAGMAVVFPMVMLQGMLSAGAMGSGVSAAIARALGSGDRPRAEALAVQRGKLESVEKTPSAKVLAAVQSQGANSYPAFGLSQSQHHAEAFRARPLSASQRAGFQALSFPIRSFKRTL